MDIHFGIVGDNKQAIEAFDQVQSKMKQTEQVATQSGMSVDDVLNKIKTGVASIGAAWSLTSFAKQVAQTRGEFQQLEVAFTTMLGSGEKARAMMNDLVHLAATTPFDLKGVANGAKQLMAYGTAAENVTEMMRRLGDIAAGMSIPLNDLVYLYGTTMTQGRMFTQDLRQFQGRGIPIAEEIAKILNISKNAVGEAVTTGKVTADVVQQAVVNMTSLGSKFGGLMDAQSKTIVGQISNIEDAFDMMMNDIGKSQEGVINSVLGGVSFLIENYEKLIPPILTAVTVWGEYKASLMAVDAWNKMVASSNQAMADSQMAQVEAIKARNLSSGTSVNTTESEATISAVEKEIAVIKEKMAIELEEAEMAVHNAENKAALAALEVDTKQDALSVAKAEYEQALLSNDAERISTAEENLNTAAVEVNSAQTALNTAREEVNTLSKSKNAIANRNAVVAEELDSVSKQKNTAITTIWTAVTNGATAAFNSLKVAMATNPFGMVIMAVTTLIGLFMTFNEEQEESLNLSEKFGTAGAKQIAQYAALKTILENTSTASKAHKDAVEQLTQAFVENGLQIDDNKDKVQQITEKWNDFTEVVKNNSIEIQKANAIQTATEEYNKNVDSAWDNFKKNLGFDDETNEGLTLALRSSISVEDLEKMREYTDRLEYLDNLGVHTVEIEKEKQKALEALAPIAARVNNATEGYATATGKSNITLDKLVPSLAGLGAELNKYQAKLNTTIDGINGAARATDGYNAKADAAAYHTRIQKMTTNELSKELEKLVKTYNGTHISMTIEWSEIGRPDWMMGKSLKELQSLAKKFAELARNNPNGVKFSGGKYYSQKQLLERAAQYNNAATEKEADQKKKEADEESKKKEREAEAKKAAAAAKKAAADAKKAAQKAKEDNQKLIKEANEAIRDNSTSLLSNGVSKQLAEAKDKYTKTIDGIEEKIKEYKKNAKALKESSSDIQKGLQPFETLKTQALEEYKKELKELADQDVQNLYNYLNEYGTVQEKKYAIYQEYADKIAKSESDIEKKSLSKERDSKLSSLNIQDIKQSIDFGGLFSESGIVLKEQLEPTLKALEAITQSEDFKQEGYDSQKVVYDLIDKLRKLNEGFDSGVLSKLADNINAYNDALTNLNIAKDKEKKALDKVIEAQERYNNAATNDEREIISKSELEPAKRALEEASESVTTFQSDVNQAATGINESAAKAVDQFNTLSNAISGLASGSLKGVGEGLMQLDKLFNNGDLTKKVGDSFVKLLSGTKIGKKVTDALSSALGQNGGVIMQIISAILSILDVLAKEGIGGIIASLVTSITDAIAGIIDNILSGKFVEQIVSAIINGIGKILNAVIGNLGHLLSFGLLSSDMGDWFNGSNAKEVAEATERLTKTNEKLNKSIDQLKDTMDKQSGMKAIETYNEAVKRQQDVIDNQRKILMYQMSYHDAHRSNSYYWSMGEDRYSQINDLLGTNVHSLDDIYQLSPEQMDKIRNNLFEVWDEITTTGKYDKSEYWEKYADLAGSIDELTEKINENLMQISFDSMRDNFKSKLLDMSSDFEDFSDDISKIFQDAMMNFWIGDEIDEKLSGLYDRMRDTMKAQNGKLTSEQINAFNDEYQRYVKEALDQRNQLSQITGYTGSSSQKASQKAWSGVGQDEVNELNGRFTALQVATESININVATILSLWQNNAVNVTEMRNMMITSNSYLEDIAKYAKKMYLEFASKLDNIEKNTKQ